MFTIWVSLTFAVFDFASVMSGVSIFHMQALHFVTFIFTILRSLVKTRIIKNLANINESTVFIRV